MKRKTFLAAIGLAPIIKVLGRIQIPFTSAICKTQADVEGPFYKAGAPTRSVIETKGTALLIEGTVLKSEDCKTPVANAVVDIWHCDDHGEYDNSGFTCRGKVATDSQGKYSFKTIFPPPYGNRPRHIHVKVQAKGYNELTTQIYFKGDPNLKNDFARNAEEARVVEIVTVNAIKKGRFDIYL